MREVLIVLLVMLATHRLTYLVVADRITRGPREFVQNWAEARWYEAHSSAPESDEWQSKLAYLLSCPWCASIWVGGLVTLSAMWTVGVTAPLLVWLASSSVTGLLWKSE